MPRQGVNKLERYKSKFGEARVKQMIPMMQQTFRNEGIEINYDGVIAQTVDSHRLVDYVQSRYGAEKTDQLMEALFKAYFTECLNIADIAVLVDVGEKVGLDRAEIKEFLESGKVSFLENRQQISWRDWCYF